MKKLLAIPLILALLAGCLAACGEPKTQDLLAGKWKGSVGMFEFDSYEFIPDAEQPLKGTVKLLGKLSQWINGTYEVIPAKEKDAKDTVKISYTVLLISTTKEYAVTVDDSTLSLQEIGSDYAMTFTRDTGDVALSGTTA